MMVLWRISGGALFDRDSIVVMISQYRGGAVMSLWRCCDGVWVL